MTQHVNLHNTPKKNPNHQHSPVESHADAIKSSVTRATIKNSCRHSPDYEFSICKHFPNFDAILFLCSRHSHCSQLSRGRKIVCFFQLLSRCACGFSFAPGVWTASERARQTNTIKSWKIFLGKINGASVAFYIVPSVAGQTQHYDKII